MGADTSTIKKKNTNEIQWQVKKSEKTEIWEAKG